MSKEAKILYLGTQIPSHLFLKIMAANPKIITLGSDGAIEITKDLTPTELAAIHKLIQPLTATELEEKYALTPKVSLWSKLKDALT